jgi:hypothetical protein
MEANPDDGERASASYYALLGMGDFCEDEGQIKKAWRKTALENHPDRNPEDREAAETRMREINKAYETLRDAQKRSAYDAWLKGGDAAAGKRYEDFSNVDPYLYSLREILAEVLKYDFSDQIAKARKKLKASILGVLVDSFEEIKKATGIDEKIIEFMQVSLPSPPLELRLQISGATISRVIMILTNVRVFLVVESSTSVQRGNTTYTTNYVNAFSFWLGTLSAVVIREIGEVSHKHEIALLAGDRVLFTVATRKELDNVMFLFHLHGLSVVLRKENGKFLGQFMRELRSMLIGIGTGFGLSVLLSLGGGSIGSIVADNLALWALMLVGFGCLFCYRFYKARYLNATFLQGSAVEGRGES